MKNEKSEINITITDSARTYIESFIKPLGEHAGFCLAVKKSGCSGFSYVADVAAAPKPGYICVVENGVNLFVDQSSIPMLHGTKIGLRQKEFGQKELDFQNPNAKAQCGCGESFMLEDKN